MKVLLFVQTGDARPKALTTPNEYSRRPQCLAGQLRAWSGKSVQTVHATNGGAFAQAFAADRWWLVECENAKAGRHCISGGCEPYRCHRADGPMSCRILASGGRS